MTVGNRIALVFDSAFGEDLTRLGEVDHAWIVDSPENPAPGGESDIDVTTFKSGGEESEEQVAYLLHVIDEHHGRTSSLLPLASVEVWGHEPTPLLTDAAAELGLEVVERTSGGFIAKRP